jgi:uncharacterized protein YkwD
MVDALFASIVVSLTSSGRREESEDHVQMSCQPTMRSTGLALIVSVVLLVALLAEADAASRLDVSSGAHILPAVGKSSWKLFRATNESRRRSELPMLRLNRELSVIARRHSRAMARKGALFHTVDIDVYLRGIAWHIWGENVGYTPWHVPSVERAFMDSPIHREHILNRAFHQVAIGSVRLDGTLWVTVFFYG